MALFTYFPLQYGYMKAKQHLRLVDPDPDFDSTPSQTGLFEYTTSERDSIFTPMIAVDSWSSLAIEAIMKSIGRCEYQLGDSKR